MNNCVNQKEKEYKFVVLEVFRLKLPMRVVCSKYDVNYPCFLNWVNKNPKLKYEMKELVKNEYIKTLEETVKVILEKEISIVDACKITNASYYSFQKYLKKLDKNKKNKIKKITDARRSEKVKVTNKKRKTSLRIKNINSMIYEIEAISKDKKIYASDMLNILIDKQIETPRIYFTNKLKEMGYKIIEY